jgi:hypothetical protein
MEILKNFKVIDGGWEEFPFIKILPGEDVFVGLPVCKLPFGETFVKPTLFARDNEIPTVFELEDLQKKLAKTKRFFLLADEVGGLKEVDQKDAKLVIRLPIDTKIEELVYMNGQILKKEEN